MPPNQCSSCSPRLWLASVALLASLAGALRVEGQSQKPPSYAAHGTDWRDGQCAQRDRQSPISIDRLLKAPPTDEVQFWYQPIKGVNLQLKALGGLLSIDMSQKLYGGVAFNNKWYPLVRIDFHAKSEHQLKGKRYPLEIQLVHRESTDPTQNLIVSVLVWSEVDPEPPNPRKPQKFKMPDPKQMDFNPNIQNFLKVAPPDKEGSSSTISIPWSEKGLDLMTMVANPLVNGSDVYMSYAGSLTSPPCVGKTQWFVRRLSVVASNDQVKALSDALYKMTFNNGNYRMIMPMNQRLLSVFRLVPKMSMDVDVDRTLNWGTNPRTDGEFEAHQLANEADMTAQRSALYIEDFARRLGNANAAYANALTKTTTVMPFEETPEGKAAAYAASVMRVRQAIIGATREVQKSVDVNMRWQAGQITAATLAHEAWAATLTASNLAATGVVAR